MRIDAKTAFWVVTDPGPESDIHDICFETTLDGLRLQFAGGLAMTQRPVLFTDRDEAEAEAKNRLLVRRVAEQIRIQRRVPADEVVQITLHDRDGTVLWHGDVR